MEDIKEITVLSYCEYYAVIKRNETYIHIQ